MTTRQKLLSLCALAAWMCSGLVCAPAQDTEARPHRAILVIIDGLHFQAPERLDLQNFRALAQQGAYVPKACLLMPYHPLSGDWASLHNSSLPNPIMLAGSLFIRPDHKLVQELFPAETLTAHSTNSRSYTSIDRGSHLSFMHASRDDDALDFAISALRTYDIRYLRIHLQDAGTAGYACSTETRSVPWKNNIWGEGSPYVRSVQHADVLLGRFVAALKDMKKWDDTLLIVTADHGQSDTGWHPTLDPAGWYTPLVFVGPGIARGRQLEYAEHIDIIPTLSALMGIERPVTEGSGRVLVEIQQSAGHAAPTGIARPTERINTQLAEYARCKSQLLLSAQRDRYLENVALLADREFYHLDVFTHWHKAGSIENMIAINQRILGEMQAALTSSQAADFVQLGAGTLAMFHMDQPAFENSHIAFRCYSDGWGLDVFGKTERGKRLSLRNFFQLEPPSVSDYHHFHEIGMDILNLGDTPGLGGAVFVVQGQRYIPSFKQSHWQILTHGGQTCCVMVSAPIKIGDRTLVAQRLLTLHASDRFIEDQLQLLGDQAIVSQCQMGVGLTKFKDGRVVLDRQNGFLLSYGAGNVADVKEIGLAVRFDPARCQSTPEDDQAVYVLSSPHATAHGGHVAHKLTAYWDSDHSIKDSDSMIKLLAPAR